MASKKKLKARLSRERKIADEMFIQIGQLSGQLHRVDQILTEAELPGPTIEAWAQQVRDVLSSLVRERGLISGGIHRAFSERVSGATSGPRKMEMSDDGEYTFMTDADIVGTDGCH